MSVQRGDVVMVDWLYSDRTGSKVRPALVVQADVYNGGLDDTILVLITSSTRRMVGAATQVAIDVSTPEGQQSGLRQNSLVQCENVSTVAQRLILRTLGTLPPRLMQLVDAALKDAEGLT
jgi:mRNA interferase MazF